MVLAGVVAGCAPLPTPTVGPWGYEFALGRFVDARTPDDARMMESAPFTVERFMTAWTQAVARTPFANAPARLDVTLKRYEATQSGRAFAVSMNVTLKGRDMAGKTLTEKELTCSAVETRGFELGDFAQQVAAQGNLTPLTQNVRDATMWQKVMTTCVRELATSFGTALNAGLTH